MGIAWRLGCSMKTIEATLARLVSGQFVLYR
jgi:hypothetical protein